MLGGLCEGGWGAERSVLGVGIWGSVRVLGDCGGLGVGRLCGWGAGCCAPFGSAAADPPHLPAPPCKIPLVMRSFPLQPC